VGKEIPVDGLEKFQLLLFPLPNILLPRPTQAVDLVFKKSLRLLFENLRKVIEIFFGLSK
jgi:hypothetical protein